jgi:hypothetical protein
MRQERHKVLAALDLLNPPDASVPGKRPEIRAKNRKISAFLRVAASLVVLMGLAFTLYMIARHEPDNWDALTNTDDMYTGEMLDDELAYYISPNRCWNDRQMVWILIEIK